jgi:Holliday junction resolvasome RuvABC endonuclease subunit
MKVLGLDISTTAIGYSILDCYNQKFKLIECHYYTPLEKFEGKKLNQLDKIEFLQMLDYAKSFVQDLISKHQPDLIAIEDFIRFLGGGSSSATIIPLAILNQTIALLAYQHTQTNKQVKISLCNVMSIRHRIKKASNLTELPDKEAIHPLLENLLKIKLPVFYTTSKQTKIAPTTYDCSDSIAVAYYAYNQLNSK